MKVLFITRSTLYTIPGGDTIQMEFTAKHLLEHGVHVDIHCDGELPNYSDYDLVHFFNSTRPAAILKHTKNLKTPYVVSTIYSDYSFYKYSNDHLLMSFLTKSFGIDGIEYFKSTVKHILGQDKIQYYPYFWLGQKKCVKKVLENAACLLPNSVSEYNRLSTHFGLNSRYHVVPNGVDFEKFNHDTEYKRRSGQILCVALIEPRKNQLRLIKAVTDTDYTLKIIGDPAPNHMDYFRRCKEAAGDNVEFISRISQDKLAQHYLESEIHAMPSWFETTGLASLEAAYMGCKVIVSPTGDVRDYLEEMVPYCDPGSVSSIKEAIDLASKGTVSQELIDLIVSRYNWRMAAEETYNAYKKALSVAR